LSDVGRPISRLAICAFSHQECQAAEKMKKKSNWTLNILGSIDGCHNCVYPLVSLIGLSCKIVSLVSLVGLVTSIEFSRINGTTAGVSFSSWTACTVPFSGSLSCFFVLFIGILAFGPYLVVFFLDFLFMYGEKQ
jgi:hypothetical protein